MPQVLLTNYCQGPVGWPFFGNPAASEDAGFIHEQLHPLQEMIRKHVFSDSLCFVYISLVLDSGGILEMCLNEKMRVAFFLPPLPPPPK